MEPVGIMSDRAGEVNMHPAAAVEVGAVPSKIFHVVAYVLSKSIQIRICTEVTPVAINGRGRSQAVVSADNGQWAGGGILSPAAVVPVE